MKFSRLALMAAAAAVAPVSAKVYFKEQFDDDAWTKRWTQPTKWKKAAEMGKILHVAGKGSAESDKGIKTSEDSRFYGISAPMDTPFVSLDKDFVIQYSVKHEQNLDCGGAYIKLLPGGKKFDAASFGGDTPYAVMFGPDVCGSTKRTHVILNYEKKNENLLISKDIHCETDQFTHLYTLVVHPDNTLEVFIDKKSVRKGKLADEFDFLEPQEIKDPEAKKPEDWVDDELIADPEEKKPEDWDTQPKELPDPSATKPDDWDDEDDGEWEAPMIPNPDFKGEWKPKMVKNPVYKGKWEHPMIPNPKFVDDKDIYKVCREEGCTHVGFELWQVKSGTIFDDIIVTDNLDEAFDFADETTFKRKDLEKEFKEEEDKKEAASMKKEDDSGSDDEGDDDELNTMNLGDEF